MEQSHQENESQLSLFAASILVAAIIFSATWIYAASLKHRITSTISTPSPTSSTNPVAMPSDITPDNSTVLPIRWGDLGVQLINTGVVDEKAFIALYDGRGGLSPADKKLLTDTNNGQIVMTQENAGVLLNLLWGFGLANKNPILEQGPMSDPKYGGADKFASTGGWTISKGNPMDHYSHHAFVTLTPAQQSLVERVSKNIYRPCCNNSTYFPDCNHGMAMLGLLELMAANNVSEQEMYRIALQVNAYWFPGTYQTIDQYFKSEGIAWDSVDPKEILGAQYSSASGFQKIKNALPAQKQQSGAGCGV